MTFLNTIIESEEASKKAIKEAHETAQKKVADAETTLQKSHDTFVEHLQDKREQELEGQKESLATLRKSIVKKGEQQADSIKTKAEGSIKKAVADVLEAFKKPA